MASMALAVTSPPMASLPSYYSSLSFSRSPSITSIPLSVSVSVSSPSSTSLYSLTSPIPPLIFCGRGDKKTAKGKRFRHSFGNSRPRNKSKGRGPPRVPTPPGPSRKEKFDLDFSDVQPIEDDGLDDEPFDD